MRFEVFQGKIFSPEHLCGQWYFRLLSANNRIVAQSEAYTRKADAVRACKSIRAAFSVTRKLVRIEVVE